MYPNHIEIQTTSRSYRCVLIEHDEWGKRLPESKLYTSAYLSTVVQFAVRMAIASGIGIVFDVQSAEHADEFWPDCATEARANVFIREEIARKAKKK